MKTVDFNILRYANCWEDARLLQKGLNPEPGSRVLSIASGGDNCFALLCNSPEILVAADISLPQLYTTELKAKAIELFNREEYFDFTGIRFSHLSLEYYRSVRSSLSAGARAYWDKNQPVISAGLVNAGKFERYFSLFRRYVLPLIHSKEEIFKLLNKKSDALQNEFYNQQWNSARWKLFFRIFFSKTVMGFAGRDPEFMREVEVNVGSHIFAKAEKHLIDSACQRNPFLHFILTGHYSDVLPEYLSPDNYQLIKRNIRAIEFRQGFVQDVIRNGEKFNAMNLSNIFEYMSRAVFSEVAARLVTGLTEYGKLAYWNLMVPRMISEILDGVGHQKELSEQLTSIDYGFFYDRFVVDQKK